MASNTGINFTVLSCFRRSELGVEYHRPTDVLQLLVEVLLTLCLLAIARAEKACTTNQWRTQDFLKDRILKMSVQAVRNRFVTFICRPCYSIVDSPLVAPQQPNPARGSGARSAAAWGRKDTPPGLSPSEPLKQSQLYRRNLNYLTKQNFELLCLEAFIFQSNLRVILLLNTHARKSMKFHYKAKESGSLVDVKLCFGFKSMLSAVQKA